MSYNENEIKVLSYFFTNIDKDVYCATDNMPVDLWALLLGGYSRSPISLRDRLLQVFTDVAKLDNVSYDDYVSELASKLHTVSLTKELDKAAKFMKIWAVNYGHNSLKDSSYNMTAIENVSIKASKELEASDQSAFQEKSTRYMDFSGDSLVTGIDETTDSLLKEAMLVYSDVKDSLIAYYKTKISRDDFKTENAWVRTCNAKAFDDARYLLPTAIKTSLGSTMPSRETERWISYLLSSDLPEVVALGDEIKTECRKITPALVERVEANKFLNRKTGTALAKRLRNTSTSNIISKNREVGVVMDNSTDIEIEVAYNLMNAVGMVDEDALYDGTVTLEEVFELGLGERGDHDDMPKETATGFLAFDIICDIGAFRDIQRHRKGTQIVETWNSHRGYSVPDVFSDHSLVDLKNKYVDIFEKVSARNKELLISNTNMSEYCLLLGHNVRFNYQCDFRQFAYLVELRSGESGHYSYRRIAQQMFKLFEEKFPMISKYLRVNMSGYSDRRKQEERIQEKIKAAESSTLADFDP